MLRGLLAAIAFLTTIPVPPKWLGNELIAPRQMLWWFVPVGALIGGLAAGIAYLASFVFPWPVCAVVGVVCLIALSGALHLDGFMDTCDGLGSRTPKERALEIMKDSRSGAFGVIGLMCLLMLKVAFLASMTGWGPATLFAAPVMGRLAQVAVLKVSRYARPEGGMGGAFFEQATDSHFLVAVLLGLAAGVASGTALGMGPAALGVGLFAAWVARRLGGHTGDTVGAASELAELLVVFAMAIAVAGAAAY